MYRVFALLAATSVLSNQALAEDQALGARIGMLGFAVEYTYTLSDRIGLRGSINGAGYGFDAEESGIDYAFDLNWDSLSVGVDFHPTRGPLRLSLGLLKNDNSLSAQSRLAGNVDIGGTIYTPAEVGTLRGEIGFDSRCWLGLVAQARSFRYCLRSRCRKPGRAARDADGRRPACQRLGVSERSCDRALGARGRARRS